MHARLTHFLASMTIGARACNFSLILAHCALSVLGGVIRSLSLASIFWGNKKPDLLPSTSFVSLPTLCPHCPLSPSPGGSCCGRVTHCSVPSSRSCRRRYAKSASRTASAIMHHSSGRWGIKGQGGEGGRAGQHYAIAHTPVIVEHD